MFQRMPIDVLIERRGGPDPLQVIDVRSPSEYAAGHVPGAINIPMHEIESRLTDLHVDHAVVLTCQSGRRATMVAELLTGHGRPSHVLEGGTAAWMAAGHPVTATAAATWSLERQVRLAVGLAVLATLALALVLDWRWAVLTAALGLGLTVAAVTDHCLLGVLIARLPWNRPTRRADTTTACCA